MAAVAKTNHLRVWTSDEISSNSSIQLEIVLEEIKDEIRLTANDDAVYLVASHPARTAKEEESCTTRDRRRRSNSWYVFSLFIPRLNISDGDIIDPDVSQERPLKLGKAKVISMEPVKPMRAGQGRQRE
jgi:hypothetical protein